MERPGCRALSISGKELRATEDVIAVAGGEHRVTAVRSVILSGHAKSLITETTLARALMETT